jgi:hypothetical protein
MKNKNYIYSIALFLSAFIILISCGKQKAEWKGSIEEKDGVTIIKNPKEGIWDSKEKGEVTISTEHQIGQLYGPEESLFDSIVDANINSKGDIYVADRGLNEIRKFNKDGEYLLTMGRKGQGPGEFQDIRTIAVNSHDDLIVFDSMLRRISIFSDNGEHIKTTKILMPDSWINPSKIFATNAKNVFFGIISNSLKLFHEFDRDWHITESYIDYEIVDNKEFEERFLGGFLGYCWFQDNGDILYTKYFYDNQIFTYNNKELVKIVRRKSDIKKPYEVQVFHDVEKALAIKDPEYDLRAFGRGIAFLGKTHQCSVGLYQLSDGHIVNFLYLRRSKDIKELGVELYDSEGKFLKYSKLRENLYYNIRYMDSSDLFYAIEREEYDKIIMFRLAY